MILPGRLQLAHNQVTDNESLPGAQVWENLEVISEQIPVDGNKGGSYLTMLSKGGFVFGIINIIGNFGTVYNDQVRTISAVIPESLLDSSLTALQGCF